MNPKPLTFLRTLIFLFLVSSSFVACSDNYQGGLDAFNQEDYKKAFKLWLPLAEQNHAQAQLNLGFMYENGKGVPQDHKESVKWYRLSAEQGLANAQHNLGLMYYNGQGVPQG